MINGQNGRDKIFDFDRNDTSHGGAGNVTLSGGDGNDRFVYDIKINPSNNFHPLVDFNNE